jgi:hypothetical protein
MWHTQLQIPSSATVRGMLGSKDLLGCFSSVVGVCGCQSPFWRHRWSTSASRLPLLSPKSLCCVRCLRVLQAPLCIGLFSLLGVAAVDVSSQRMLCCCRSSWRMLCRRRCSRGYFAADVASSSPLMHMLLRACWASSLAYTLPRRFLGGCFTTVASFPMLVALRWCIFHLQVQFIRLVVESVSLPSFFLYCCCLG